MTPRVDYSREAVELLAASYEHEFGRRDGGVPATMRALRAALDAAELDSQISCEIAATKASADGYARGVRDAARVVEAREAHWATRKTVEHCELFEVEAEMCGIAILALLPADAKEKNDGV